MNEDRLVTINKSLIKKQEDHPQRLLSPQLEKDLNVSNSQIYAIGKEVKKYKKKIHHKMDELDSYMDAHTQKEREAVEEALKVLRHKVEKVKNDEKYLEMEKELEYIEKKLNITMENIFPHYAKAVKKIYEAYPEKKERTEKLLEFHDVVGDAFLTKDEKKVMKLIKDQIREIPHKVIDFNLLC